MLDGFSPAPIVRLLTVTTGMAALALTTPVRAAAPQGEASVSVDPAGAQGNAQGANGTSKTKKPRDNRKDLPWIKRWAPERNMWELGVFGGVWFPSNDHEFFEADQDLPEQGYKDLNPVGGDVGVRLAYLPIRHFGLEVEGAVLPSQTDDGNAALFWAGRGHLIAQVGLWSVVPFVVGGLSAMGVSSNRNALGNDADFAVHFGGGVKFFLHRYVMLRLDLRDIVAAKRGVDSGITNNGEITLGLSLTLGRKRRKAPPKPSDRDGDGFIDDDDQCPDEPGVAPDGCPIPDTDGDGFLDPDDACPEQPGVPPDGCPIPDTDGDGFLDPDDACPQEPGVEPDGCPLRDTDGDGLLDPDDACPQQPETKNGFEDSDGCPDEVPDEVVSFTGVIEGIYFDVNKASIKKRSEPKLLKAVEVLEKYPDVRLEVSGHTDTRGKHDYNVNLSRERADAVKQFLVDQGIDASRITTRGAGPDEPIDTNRTKAGRAKNRRIEFKILQ